MQKPRNDCRKKTYDLDLVLVHAQKLSIWEMSGGSFSNDDIDGNENVKKAIGLLSKTTTDARASRFFVHFFAVTA